MSFAVVSAASIAVQASLELLLLVVNCLAGEQEPMEGPGRWVVPSMKAIYASAVAMELHQVQAAPLAKVSKHTDSSFSGSAIVCASATECTSVQASSASSNDLVGASLAAVCAVACAYLSVQAHSAS